MLALFIARTRCYDYKTIKEASMAKNDHISEYLKEKFNAVNWDHSEVGSNCGQDGRIDKSHVWIVDKTEVLNMDDVI